MLIRTCERAIRRLKFIGFHAAKIGLLFKNEIFVCRIFFYIFRASSPVLFAQRYFLLLCNLMRKITTASCVMCMYVRHSAERRAIDRPRGWPLFPPNSFGRASFRLILWQFAGAYNSCPFQRNNKQVILNQLVSPRGYTTRKFVVILIHILTKQILFSVVLPLSVTKTTCNQNRPWF